MKKIPTAEEFLNNKPFIRSDLQCETNYQLMIEFAKLHVEACKKEIADKAIEYYDSILACYPLENIK